MSYVIRPASSVVNSTSVTQSSSMQVSALFLARNRQNVEVRRRQFRRFSRRFLIHNVSYATSDVEHRTSPIHSLDVPLPALEAALKNERPLSSAFTRRDLFRYTGLLGAAAGITATLAACGGGPSSTSVVGGSASTGDLTTAIGYGNDQSFDPMQTASGFLMAAVNHVYEGLLENDPGTGETYAALAQAVPTDATASSWTMKIREGANLARRHSGHLGRRRLHLRSHPRSTAERTDPLLLLLLAAVRHQGRRPNGDPELQLPVQRCRTAVSPIAKIMPKHVFDGHWDEAKSGALVVGSGPYKLKSHTPKSNTAFEAFEAYNGPRPANFATMNWLSIVDTSSRIARVSGNNAGAQLADNIPVANVPTLTSGGRTVEGNPGMNLMYLLFDTTQAPFDDVRVRQAMFYAINTPKMIEIALGGKAAPATSYLYERNPDYARASTVYSYDPDKARSLLAAAGVSGLDLTLLSTNVSWLSDCLPTIKESWDAVGFNTTLEPQDTSAMVSKLNSGQKFQIAAGTSNPQGIRQRRRPSRPLHVQQGRLVDEDLRQVGRHPRSAEDLRHHGRSHPRDRPGKAQHPRAVVPEPDRRKCCLLPGSPSGAPDCVGIRRRSPTSLRCRTPASTCFRRSRPDPRPLGRFPQLRDPPMARVLPMLIRRLLILIPLILGIIAFVFIVMQFAPTDPATAAFNGGNPTAEQLQQFKEENGLLDPLPLQYGSLRDRSGQRQHG